MKPTIITASLGLFFAVANAAPLSSPQVRLTPNEVDSMQAHDSGADTSGVSGIRTTVVAGDPTQAGPYTIRLSIPANTKIQAHTHRDNRTAIVISGVWYFGYGPKGLWPAVAGSTPSAVTSGMRALTTVPGRRR